MEFKKLKITDKAQVDGLLSCCKRKSLEYNFTTMFIWQEQYASEFAIEDEILYARSGKLKKTYLFPCGRGDIISAVRKLLDMEDRLVFHSVNSGQREFLEEKFPGRFDFTESRDTEDYVYLAESLMQLKGKKLSSKRNHINRFIADNTDWKYEAITDANIDEVQKMHNEWCDMADVAGRPGLAEETAAVRNAFKYYNELGLSGGLIRAGNRIVAFSMGDELNESTFLVHIEKAFNSVNGAYTIINREFVTHECTGYEFINREDDTGDEGLRKAKLSYRPHEIVMKYTAKELV